MPRVRCNNVYCENNEDGECGADEILIGEDDEDTKCTTFESTTEN
jgi:hypothetical protein